MQEPQDPVDQALSTTIQRLCEQHMYFTALYHSAATSEASFSLSVTVLSLQADMWLQVMSL